MKTLIAMFLIMVGMQACAHRMKCHVIPDHNLGGGVEVCNHKECRDLFTGQFVPCPKEDK